MHATPLCHAVGEGLGVRAKNSGRAAHEGFVSLIKPRLVLFKPHKFLKDENAPLVVRWHSRPRAKLAVRVVGTT